MYDVKCIEEMDIDQFRDMIKSQYLPFTLR